MDRKRKTGEVVVYLLATAAETLLLPIIAPGPIRGIEFFSSGGGIVLDSPFAGVDGDGSATGSTSEPTPTLTEVPTLPPVEKENKETDLNNKIQIS